MTGRRPLAVAASLLLAACQVAPAGMAPAPTDQAVIAAGATSQAGTPGSSPPAGLAAPSAPAPGAEGGRLAGVAKVGGTPLAGAEVSVLALRSGARLATGTTNADGIFALVVPGADGLGKVVVRAGGRTLAAVAKVGGPRRYRVRAEDDGMLDVDERSTLAVRLLGPRLEQLGDESAVEEVITAVRELETALTQNLAAIAGDDVWLRDLLEGWDPARNDQAPAAEVLDRLPGPPIEEVLEAALRDVDEALQGPDGLPALVPEVGEPPAGIVGETVGETSIGSSGGSGGGTGSVPDDGAGGAAEPDPSQAVRIGLSGTVRGPLQNVLVASTMRVIAGAGNGSVDGTGPAARFGYPAAIGAGPPGTLYVADARFLTIRRLDETPAGWTSTTIATPETLGVVDQLSPDAFADAPLAKAPRKEALQVTVAPDGTPVVMASYEQDDNVRYRLMTLNEQAGGLAAVTTIADEEGRITSLTTGPDGSVYACDGYVTRFRPTGGAWEASAFLQADIDAVVDGTPTQLSEFEAISPPVFTPNGASFVTALIFGQMGVFRLDTTGPVPTLTTTGAVQGGSSLAVGPDGTLFGAPVEFEDQHVPATERAIVMVRQLGTRNLTTFYPYFDLGQVATDLVAEGYQASSPGVGRGITVDATGRVFLAGGISHRVFQVVPGAL